MMVMVCTIIMAVRLFFVNVIMGMMRMFVMMIMMVVLVMTVRFMVMVMMNMSMIMMVVIMVVMLIVLMVMVVGMIPDYFFLSMYEHVYFGTGDPAFLRLLRFHPHPGDSQSVEFIQERFRIRKQFQQRACQHIAGSAHAAFEG